MAYVAQAFRPASGRLQAALEGCATYDGKGRIVGQTLLVIGLIIAAIGAAISLGLPLGRLPGDIVIRREGFTFYLPITTCIVISLVLTLIGTFFRR